MYPPHLHTHAVRDRETDSVLLPGKGQACSSKLQIVPMIHNKNSQFNFHAAANLCREDGGDSELGSLLTYPQPLVSDTALDSLMMQHGRDSSSDTSALIFFRHTECCFCGYTAMWSVGNRQAFASRLVLKWADRHQYSIMGLFLIFVQISNFWDHHHSLVQWSRQKGDTIQRGYTQICTERLHVERAYHEHRPLGEEG